MKRDWQTLDSKIVYQNQWISLSEDKVILPGGKEGRYSFLKKYPGVFIIAQDKDNSIYLIKEYRYPIKKWIWQLPAGVVDPKRIITEAKRELLEETGLEAKKWTKIGSFFCAPGHETTYLYVILASDLKTSDAKNANQEDDESILEVKRFSQKEIIRMIQENKIECGLTLASLNIYFQYKSK